MANLGYHSVSAGGRNQLTVPGAGVKIQKSEEDVCQHKGEQGRDVNDCEPDGKQRLVRSGEKTVNKGDPEKQQHYECCATGQDGQQAFEKYLAVESDAAFQRGKDSQRLIYRNGHHQYEQG